MNTLSYIQELYFQNSIPTGIAKCLSILSIFAFLELIIEKLYIHISHKQIPNAVRKIFSIDTALLLIFLLFLFIEIKVHGIFRQVLLYSSLCVSIIYILYKKFKGSDVTRLRINLLSAIFGIYGIIFWKVPDIILAMSIYFLTPKISKYLKNSVNFEIPTQYLSIWISFLTPVIILNFFTFYILETNPFIITANNVYTLGNTKVDIPIHTNKHATIKIYQNNKKLKTLKADSSGDVTLTVNKPCNITLKSTTSSLYSTSKKIKVLSSKRYKEHLLPIKYYKDTYDGNKFITDDKGSFVIKAKTLPKTKIFILDQYHNKIKKTVANDKGIFSIKLDDSDYGVDDTVESIKASPVYLKATNSSSKKEFVPYMKKINIKLSKKYIEDEERDIEKRNKEASERSESAEEESEREASEELESRGKDAYDNMTPYEKSEIHKYDNAVSDYDISNTTEDSIMNAVQDTIADREAEEDIDWSSDPSDYHIIKVSDGIYEARGKYKYAGFYSTFDIVFSVDDDGEVMQVVYYRID